MEIVGLLVTVVFNIILAAVVILVVSKLGLGLEVDGFGSAMIAAVVIAIATAIVNWLIGLLGISLGIGVIGAIVALIVGALVLMVSDKFVKGMKVNGFVGAIVAAVAIAVLNFLFFFFLGLIIL